MRSRRVYRATPFAAVPIALLVGLLVAPSVPAQTAKNTAASDRYLFNDSHFHLTNYVQQGTDIHRYLEIMDPIWALLTPQASLAIRKGNYERLFDAARVKVRAWEKANVGVAKR